MTDNTGTRFVAYCELGAGGAWGTAPTEVEAISKCQTYAEDFASKSGDFEEDAVVRINVVSVPDGFYWMKTERGSFSVSYKTDEVAGYAEPLICIDWFPTKGIAAPNVEALTIWQAYLAGAVSQ
jgi:hypothetical protein